MKALILAAALLASPAVAAAQAWEAVTYDEPGFAVQSPGRLTPTPATWSGAGLTVPAVVYALDQPEIRYSVTVADFSGVPASADAVTKAAIAAVSEGRQVALDTTARIDRHFGRFLTLVAADGSRSTVAIFYLNDRLYVLEGRTLPPDPMAASSRAIRFQQSLEFTGLGDEANRPENRGRGGGGPGPGAGPDGRPRPPPQAFEACKGRSAGDAVRHQTPRGLVDATCVQTPEGLAARPDNPPFARPPRG